MQCGKNMINTVMEQKILTQWRELDPLSQQEILDFIEFLRFRRLSEPKRVNTKPFPVTRVEDGIGCVGYQGEPKSIEEMQQGIIDEARKQWQQEVRK